MSRSVARVFAYWRTGLSGPVIVRQAGTAVNYFGTGLILPFEIIYATPAPFASRMSRRTTSASTPTGGRSTRPSSRGAARDRRSWAGPRRRDARTRRHCAGSATVRRGSASPSANRPRHEGEPLPRASAFACRHERPAGHVSLSLSMRRGTRLGLLAPNSGDTRARPRSPAGHGSASRGLVNRQGRVRTTGEADAVGTPDWVGRPDCDATVIAFSICNGVPARAAREPAGERAGTQLGCLDDKGHRRQHDAAVPTSPAADPRG